MGRMGPAMTKGSQYVNLGSKHSLHLAPYRLQSSRIENIGRK